MTLPQTDEYGDLAKIFWADLYESPKEELIKIEAEIFRETTKLLKEQPLTARATLKVIIDKWEFDKLLKDMYVWQRVEAAEKGIIRGLKQ